MFNQNTFFMNLVLATKRAKDNDISNSEAAKAALFGSFGAGANPALGLVTTIETMKGKENEKELEDRVQAIDTENRSLKETLEEVKAVDIVKLQSEVTSLNTKLATVQAAEKQSRDTNVKLTEAFNKAQDKIKSLEGDVNTLNSVNADLLGDKLGLEDDIASLKRDFDALQSKYDDCQKSLSDCQKALADCQSGQKKTAKRT